jgi:hypothetical protein
MGHGLALVVGALWALGDKPAAPTPEAQEELRGLSQYAQAFCDPIAGDRDAFIRAAMPFAPLYLAAAKGPPAEVEALRGLFLGMSGRACGVDAAALVRGFACGKTCIDKRRSAARQGLRGARALVGRIRPLQGLRVVAQWGTPGEFRINDLFAVRGRHLRAAPSAVMGLVPSASWKPFQDLGAELRGTGVSEAEALALVAELRRIGFVAIVRDGSVLRAIGVGIGDNEAGLLFAPGPIGIKVGDRTEDGRDYSVVEKVEPGIWYYETT